MASVQVLPNSSATKKQGHLELGKKKLEEFRKKKAAKKAAATNQLPSSDADRHPNLPGNNHDMPGQVSLEGEGIAANTNESTVVHEDNRTASSYIDKVVNHHEVPDISLSITSTTLSNGNYSAYISSGQESVNDNVPKLSKGTSNLFHIDDGYYDRSRETNELNHKKSSKSLPDDGFPMNQTFLWGSDNRNLSVSQKIDNSRLDSLPNGKSGGYDIFPTYHGHQFDQPAENRMETLPDRSDGGFTHNSLRFSSSSFSNSNVNEVEPPVHSSSMLYDSLATVAVGGKIADAIGRRLNIDSSPWRASEPSTTTSTFGFGSSANQAAPPLSGYSGTFGRSRPSFLDSIGVPRVALTPNLSHGEPQKIDPPQYFDSSLLQNPDPTVSSSLQQPLAEPNLMDHSLSLSSTDFNKEKEASSSNSAPLSELQFKLDTNSHGITPSHNFQVANKDEDFAALEQHIEDLTKEKFSLQRALETAQTLSESLASENSSLAEGFNQQGKVITQLRADMESLQEEIKTQLLALESAKLEYTKAKLECSAADERAKMLASEVISLEEKALRLRSNELKQEKALENLYSEISSYKRKVSILEKERQDMQSTVSAMQEEKKLLQSKLWKASVNEKTNVQETSCKVDASTSTEPVDENYQEASANKASSSSSLTATQDVGPSEAPLRNYSEFALLPEDGGLNLSDSLSDLPQDQLRMIDNIKSLLSEVALEKEELVQALRIESSNCSKLKEMNRDLSQKLETQTQRLELLISQRMATESISGKPADTLNVHDTTDFADEGDEVVERVLGWIMKLFPGGPAKRRTSKLI